MFPYVLPHPGCHKHIRSAFEQPVHPNGQPKLGERAVVGALLGSSRCLPQEAPVIIGITLEVAENLKPS